MRIPQRHPQEKKHRLFSSGSAEGGDEMIHDGVELPKLLTVDRAAEVLGTDTPTVRRWIDDRTVSTMRINGIVHVLTESIADRLGEKTLSRHNRDCE